jgi:FkbM family methyltransferase
VLNDLSIAREVGVSGVRALHHARRDPNRAAVTTVSARSLQHPFTVRHGTTDASEFVHTVCRRTYAIGLPQRARTILDLGANIGDTAAWFLSRFPDATVLSVEPDADNYAIAARNLAPYGARSILVRAAIWREDGEVALQANPSWPSGSHVADGVASTDRVRAVSMATLLRQHNIGDIDLLKCDIEEAEAAVFAADPDPWLSRTGVLQIEIHSPAAQRVVEEATARCGFGPGLRHRDITVFVSPRRE